MAAAEKAQQYLDLHKIGPLFENLMASLIKDMPNEPITYLIRMLQKADQRLRSPRGAPDRAKSASASVLHSKYGMGLSGHPAPKRNIEEPHMALPGGGRASAVWSSTNLSSSQERPLSSHGRPKTADQKKRGYEKPWLSSSKTATKRTVPTEGKNTKAASHGEVSGSTKKKTTATTTTATTTWNTETKVTAKDFDEMLQTQHVTQSSSENEKQKHILYEGVKSWAAGDENAPPPSKRILAATDKGSVLVDLTNDELDIRDIDLKTTQPPVDVNSKSLNAKNITASRKADQKKMKLKELLYDDTKSVCNGHDDDDESGDDDDTIEVFEYSDDLMDEGVKTISKSGAKLKGTRQIDEGANFQIKICARCAKVMTSFQTAAGFSDFDSQVTTTQRKALSDITGSEEDFESVSQIADPQSQKWPVIAPDDDSSQVRQMNSASVISMGRTEFFEANAPKVQKDVQNLEARSQSEKLETEIGGWQVKQAESSTDFTQ